jgi:hypothetical protein
MPKPILGQAQERRLEMTRTQLAEAERLIDDLVKALEHIEWAAKKHGTASSLCPLPDRIREIARPAIDRAKS